MVAFPDHRDRAFSLNGRPLGIPHLDMGMKEEGMNGIDFTRLLNSNPLLFNIPEGVNEEEAGYLVQNANGEPEEAKTLPNRRVQNAGGNVSYPWDANKQADNAETENDVFSLRAKSIEAVDTEQLKEETGNLFFAVVDTRKEEIYFVNMATKDNYNKALRVIRGMPEEQPTTATRNKNQLGVAAASGIQQQQHQQTLSQLASRLAQPNQAQSINQRVQQMSKNPQQVDNEAYTELLFPFSHKYY